MSSPPPLRINFIMHRPSLAGGVKSTRLIAEALQRRGHQVTLAHLSLERPWPKLWQFRLMKERLAYWWSRRGKGPKRHHLESSTARLLPIARNRIRPDDVPDADVCCASFWKCREWVESWPAEKGVKVYYLRHYEIHDRRQEARIKATYRLPGLKVCIASWLAKIMKDEFGDPHTILVPNGIDWNQFNSTPRDKQPVPTVGLVYRNQPWKGIKTAFAAIRQVQQDIPQLKLLMFGPDDIHESPVPANLEYHKQPAQSLIPQLYRRADVWLMPSTSEGLGMPGLEAAACRCPLVVTRSGGPEDYIEHEKSGYLVDVDDVPAMAQGIRRIVQQSNESWRAMSEASYQIAQRFDWDRSAALLEDLFRTQIAQARASQP